MISERIARKVITFLVQTGYASPLDVGVCVLGDPDGVRAWRILNQLMAEGYVIKPRHAKYQGVHGLAATQREIWQ